MIFDTSQLHGLPVEEKLRIVEFLWDEIGDATAQIPLPEWVEQEALRRRDEMQKDPSIGLSHEEVWRRIDGQNG
ncbi:MAG: addiction module protein [Pirellulales bacterium]